MTHLAAIKGDIQDIIAARVRGLREAYANNMISNLVEGSEDLEAMIERARQPISNDEFFEREEALWMERLAKT